MENPLTVGARAPDFDLASTEDAVLTLHDEVPRKALLLHFFADPAADRTRRDLQALAGLRDALSRKRVAILGVSAAKLDDLKRTQLDLGLPYPLLHDDRGFSAHYGLGPGEGEESGPEAALYLVDRDQRVRWMSCPAAPIEGLVGEVEAAVRRLPTLVSNYPRSVVNRVVDWWVNRLRRARAA